MFNTFINNNKILQASVKEITPGTYSLDNTNIISDNDETNNSDVNILGASAYKSNLFFAVLCFDLKGSADNGTYTYTITPGKGRWHSAVFEIDTIPTNVTIQSKNVVYSPKLGCSIMTITGNTTYTKDLLAYNALIRKPNISGILSVDGHLQTTVSNVYFDVYSGTTYPHNFYNTTGYASSYNITQITLPQAFISFKPCASPSHLNTSVNDMHYKGVKYTLITDEGDVGNQEKSFYNYRVMSGATLANTDYSSSASNASNIIIYSRAKNLTLTAEYPGLHSITSNTITKKGVNEFTTSLSPSNYFLHAKPTLYPGNNSFVRSGTTANNGYFGLSSADTTYEVARNGDLHYLFPKLSGFTIESAYHNENIVFCKLGTNFRSTRPLPDLGLSHIFNDFMTNGLVPRLHDIYGPVSNIAVNNYIGTFKNNKMISDSDYSYATNEMSLVKSYQSDYSVFIEDYLPPSLNFRIINESGKDISICANYSCLVVNDSQQIEFEWSDNELVIDVVSTSGYNGAYCLVHPSGILVLPMIDNNHITENFHSHTLCYKYYRHQILSYARLSDDGYYELKFTKYTSNTNPYVQLEIIGHESLSDSASIDFIIGVCSGSLLTFIKSAITTVTKNSTVVIGGNIDNEIGLIDTYFNNPTSINANCRTYYKVNRNNNIISLGWVQNGVLTKYTSYNSSLVGIPQDISKIMNFTKQIIIFSGTTVPNENGEIPTPNFPTKVIILVQNNTSNIMYQDSLIIRFTGVNTQNSPHYIPSANISPGDGLTHHFNIDDDDIEYDVYIKIDTASRMTGNVSIEGKSYVLTPGMTLPITKNGLNALSININSYTTDTEIL